MVPQQERILRPFGAETIRSTEEMNDKAFVYRLDDEASISLITGRFYSELG